MTRNIWKPSLALGAVFALCGAATAAERDTMLLSGGTKGSATTMTLGGQGTAAQAATEDTELTHGGRYRGYYGWGGGYGYRGYYGGGWNRGWGGHYGGWNRGFYPRSAVSFNFYRPRYYGGWGGGYGGGWGGYYSAPAYYSSYSYYRSYPVYSSYYDCGPSIYLGISGGTGSGAPVVTLGGNFAQPQVQPAGQAQPAQPMAQPVQPEGTFPYDGGPANPVPLPQADPNAAPQPIPPAAPSTDLPVSSKARPGLAPAKSPYKYKAYGEK